MDKKVVKTRGKSTKVGSTPIEERKAFLEDLAEVYYKYYDESSMPLIHPDKDGPYLFDEVPSRINNYDSDEFKPKQYLYWKYHLSCYTRQIESEATGLYRILRLIDSEDHPRDYQIMSRGYFMVLFDMIYSVETYLSGHKFRRGTAKYDVIFYMTEEYFMKTLSFKVNSLVGFFRHIAGRYYQKEINMEVSGDIRRFPDEVKDNSDFQYMTLMMSGKLPERFDITEKISGITDFQELLEHAGIRIVENLIKDSPFCDKRTKYYLKKSLVMSLQCKRVLLYGVNSDYYDVIKLMMNKYSREASLVLYEIIRNPRIISTSPEMSINESASLLSGVQYQD